MNQAIYIKNGTIATMGPAGILDGGAVLLSDGKIKYAGIAEDINLPVQDCQLIDAAGVCDAGNRGCAQPYRYI